MEKQDFMRHAIALAKNGIGAVDPNPLVGAVIVKDGEIIGEGWHARFGGLHAERNALANCRTSPKGATIYDTGALLSLRQNTSLHRSPAGSRHCQSGHWFP